MKATQDASHYYASYDLLKVAIQWLCRVYSLGGWGGGGQPFLSVVLKISHILCDFPNLAVKFRSIML